MKLYAFHAGGEEADLAAFDPFAQDPQARLGTHVEGLKLNLGASDDVVSKPALRHAGGIEFFPGARFYVHGSEYEFARAPAICQKDLYVQADLDHPVDWLQLQGEHDVFGDGRVIIFPTPGHSPGHQSLLVRLPTRDVILVADAAVPRNLELNALPAIVWNSDAMVESWRRIRAMRAEFRAELIFTHDLDWGAKTRVAPSEWYE